MSDFEMCPTPKPGEAITITYLPKWQPIETAPRDGSLVLVYAPEGMWGSKQPHLVAQYEESDGEWWSIDDVCHIQPTHWMPLPKAPE